MEGSPGSRRHCSSTRRARRTPLGSDPPPRGRGCPWHHGGPHFLGKQFWINILLTILGYIPGIVHAVWVIAKY